MQDCPDCGGTARDVHSFCPECGQPLSSGSSSRLRGGGGSSSSSSSSSSDDEDGIGRRQLLMYGGAAVGTAAVGGGAGFLLLSGGGGGPASVARSFIQHLDQGNQEQAQSLLHSDSPLQGNLGLFAGLLSQADVSIDSVEVVSESENSATVRLETTASMGGQTQSDVTDITLRTEGGEWRVMNLQQGASGNTSG